MRIMEARQELISVHIIKFDRVPSANLENAVGGPRRKPTCRWTSWSIDKPNTVNEITITSRLFPEYL